MKIKNKAKKHTTSVAFLSKKIIETVKKQQKNNQTINKSILINSSKTIYTNVHRIEVVSILLLINKNIFTKGYAFSFLL